jgi:hypothetical protein
MFHTFHADYAAGDLVPLVVGPNRLTNAKSSLIVHVGVIPFAR